MATPVQAEYDRHKTDDPSDSGFSVDECERLLKKLIPNDPKEMRVTIVIDALDECEDSGYELLESLKGIVKSRPRSVRLLLSSQMHVRVAPFFGDNGIQSIQIYPARTNDDMQNFIRNEMEKQRETSLKGILHSDQELWAKVAKELSDCAKGM